LTKVFTAISCALFLFLAGCSYELEEVEPPKNLIPKDSLTIVLKDIMMLEAYVKTQKNNVHQFYKIMPASADSIFEVHGVDSSRYISSMEYYSKKQEVLMEMYNEIQDDIVLESAKLQEEEK